MRKYSLKNVIAVAFAVSFLTAFIVSSLSGVLAANAAVSDFFGRLPFFNWFVPQETQLSKPSEPSVQYVPVVDYEKQIINAVKAASPAVVSITVTKNVPVIEQYFINPFGNDPFFRQFFGEEFQIPQFRQKGFQKQEVGGGTGFIISGDGLILTNKHVVADTKAEYTVFTNDGRKYSAEVLARDPMQDLAVLKIGATGLPTIKLGNSDNIEVGQTAIAIGNALGEFRNTVSVGVVSGLSRSITASGGGVTETLQDVIQTDASINPGNSGGPLLNLRGEVIGINTAIVQGAQSIGFAIPINKAKRAINDVITKGRIITPYLGVRYLTITPVLQEERKLPYDYGALIAKGDKGEPAIVPGSPAEIAGIKEGDIILEFGGRKVDKDHQLANLIVLYSVGEAVSVKIWRDGETLTLNAVLVERPSL